MLEMPNSTRPIELRPALEGEAVAERHGLLQCTAKSSAAVIANRAERPSFLKNSLRMKTSTRLAIVRSLRQ